MATVDEIEAARSQAVRNADFQVVEAIARRNGSFSPGTRDDLNVLIDELMAARTALNGKAVAASIQGIVGLDVKRRSVRTTSGESE